MVKSEECLCSSVYEFSWSPALPVSLFDPFIGFVWRHCVRQFGGDVTNAELGVRL